MRKTMILGGPGAGKTTRLLKIVRDALERGVPPSKIAFVAFARSDAEEAKAAASKEFGIDPRDLVYFRTIHSLAFRELGLTREEVLGEDHLAALSELTGELVPNLILDFDAPAAGRNADPLLTLDHFARTTKTTLRESWESHGSDVPWRRVERFSAAYEAFKRDVDVVDFTDMLSLYARSDLPPVDVEVAIVDEGQDLTRLQLDVVGKAFASADELWVAGDPNQSVHRWAGADGDWMADLIGSYDVEVLPTSHRLPKAVFDLSKEILGRFEKPSPTIRESTSKAGSVSWVASADEVDLTAGDWLLLARTRSLMTPLISAARAQGALYSVKGESSVRPEHVRAIAAWEALRAGRSTSGASAAIALRAAKLSFPIDEEREEVRASDLAGIDFSAIWHDALVGIALDSREYYLTALRRGEKLTNAPRVRIDTIHGSKGKEADDVLLSLDATYRTNRAFEEDPDSEHRVYYVGATRARGRLILKASAGRYAYEM